MLWSKARCSRGLLCLALCAFLLSGCTREPLETCSETEPTMGSVCSTEATAAPETLPPETTVLPETAEETTAESVFREPPSEKEMLSAFMDYMNAKAAAIGMTGSKFNDPVGMYNFTTARDILRLMVCAEGYDQLADIWSARTHTVEIGGENPRQQTVTSTFRDNPLLEPYYGILGGKDGELPAYEVRNLAVILEIPESGDKLAVVALCAYGQSGGETGSRAAVRQIADAALAKYRDPDADLSGYKVHCQSAIACLIPEEGADPENLQILFEKDADAQKMPASVSKVLTAICLLDVQQDLEATFAYSTFDTNIGGFYSYDFLPGDEVSYKDALYAMLLPSSNVTARALARMAGWTILTEEIALP